MFLYKNKYLYLSYCKHTYAGTNHNVNLKNAGAYSVFVNTA